MSYGILTPTDIETLERSLAVVADRFASLDPFPWFEIGLHTGETSRGVREYLWQRGIRQQHYVGIDSERDLPIAPPFSEAVLVLGDSMFAHDRVPGQGYAWGFIDGCHCINHVAMDFIHYGTRIRSGGLLVFHDTARHFQGTRLSEQPDTRTGIGVRAALAGLGLLAPTVADATAAIDGPPMRPDWRCIDLVEDAAYPMGGVAVFEKS